MVDAAGVTHDVTLNGEGYQLTPGGYKRSVGDAGEAGRVTEVVHRLAQWSSGGLAESVGFLPVEDGQGLRLAPRGVAGTATSGSATAHVPPIVYDARNFLCAGPRVYEVATVAGNFAGLTLSYTGAGDATSMMIWEGKLRVCYGSHGYATYDGASWSFTGDPADYMVQYAGVWLRARAGSLSWMASGGSWTQLPFYHRVTGFLTHAGALLIGTDEGLFRMTARQRPKDPAASPSVYDWFDWTIQPVIGLPTPQGQHFWYLTEYQGAVYYWHAGHIWRLRGNAAERCAGPSGSWLTGMCQAAGYLVVGLYDWQRAGREYTLWLHDGSGWWRLAEGAAGSAAEEFVSPGALEGVEDARLICWSYGTRHVRYWRFDHGMDHQTSALAAASILQPFGQAEPERSKSWVGVGLQLGALGGPDALGSSPATWHLDYSTNMGATWTTALSFTPTALEATQTAAISVTARRLWLRVRAAGSGGGGQPRLRAVWAVEQAGAVVAIARRRRWEVRLRCSDQVVLHTGARDDRPGRTLAADLLALAGLSSFAFVDLDGSAHTAWVVEVEQSVGKNWEPRGGESEVKLVLETV